MNGFSLRRSRWPAVSHCSSRICCSLLRWRLCVDRWALLRVVPQVLVRVGALRRLRLSEGEGRLTAYAIHRCIATRADGGTFVYGCKLAVGESCAKCGTTR